MNLLPLTSQETLYYMQWFTFVPTLVHMECVVDKVTLRQIYLHIIQFPPVSYHSITASYSFN